MGVGTTVVTVEGSLGTSVEASVLGKPSDGS